MAEEKKGSWCDIFKTFKYAISPQKLLVALVGLIVFNLLSIAFFQENTMLISARDHLGNAFSLATGQPVPPYNTFVEPGAGPSGYSMNMPESGINLMAAAQELGQVPLSFLPFPPEGSTPSETAWHYVRLAVFYLCIWIVFAAIVGVITRISAVQVARDENIGLKEAFKFAMRKYLSYFAPPVLVLIAFLIVGVLLNFLIGLLNLIPVVGPTIFALLFPVSLVLGLTAVIVILFGTLGSPLMGPAIGVEGQDTFDALSRAYHYSIQRLGRYVLYMVILFFFMALSGWFVKTFIIRGIDRVTERAFVFSGLGTDVKEQAPAAEDRADESGGDADSRLGEKVSRTATRYQRMVQGYRYTWPLRANYIINRGGEKRFVEAKLPGDIVMEKVQPDNEGRGGGYRVIRGGSNMFVVNKGEGDYEIVKIELESHEEVGGFILGVWLKGLYYLSGAFVISFFFTGSTIIYYILRKQIDGAELDEVYIEGEEEEFEFGEEPEEENQAEETEETEETK